MYMLTLNTKIVNADREDWVFINRALDYEGFVAKEQEKADIRKRIEQKMQMLIDDIYCMPAYLATRMVYEPRNIDLLREKMEWEGAKRHIVSRMLQKGLQND